MLPLRPLGPMTTTSAWGKPASSKRFAMACAATVVLPMESVVLISISSLKMSRAVSRVAASPWDAAHHAACAHRPQTRTMTDSTQPRYFKFDSPHNTKNQDLANAGSSQWRRAPAAHVLSTRLLGSAILRE